MNLIEALKEIKEAHARGEYLWARPSFWKGWREAVCYDPPHGVERSRYYIVPTDYKRRRIEIDEKMLFSEWEVLTPDAVNKGE